MNRSNPYLVSFGKRPHQIIERRIEKDTIINSFTSDPVGNQIFMITGVRGSGKTVLMTEVAAQLQKEKNWTVIDLSPEKDMLESAAAKLAEEKKLRQVFKDANISFSLPPLNVSFGKDINDSDPEVALTKMLKSMKKKGMNLLICVDEVTNNEHVRIFSSVFQILVRQDLPVFLLMTGLYQNIHDLKNEKSLTFLYRAAKIELKPLGLYAMANNYQDTLNVDRKEALEMAKSTKGYSLAFQSLGARFWENGELSDKAIRDFKADLYDNAYEKLWSELTPKEKQVMRAIAKTKSGSVKEIRDDLQMTSEQFSPYRKRFIDKGLIDGTDYGIVKLSLPFMDEFIAENDTLED